MAPSIESYIPHEPLRADFFDSFGPFDGIKRDCWEGGERVPTLARWPGHIPQGRVVTQPSISYDWLRTFAEVAGVPAPARADGISLLSDLTGRGQAAGGNYVYVEYFEQGRTPDYSVFAASHRNRKRGQMQLVRTGSYAGVRYNIQAAADPFEIYDVSVDPKETNNLAPSNPTLEQQMQALVLQARRANSSAPRPYDLELVPAEVASATSEGLEWQAFEGPFPWVPDFELLSSVAQGVAAVPDLAKLTHKDNIDLFFKGYIEAPRDGDYTFYLRADTGAVLRIHDARVIDADFGYPAGEERSGSIRLQAGLHPFRLYYAHGLKGIPDLSVAWSGPQIPKGPIPSTLFRHKSGGR